VTATVKVSVVLPTYNQSHFLPEAIDTLLKQTYQDFELIIVNDGSKDQTAEILKTIANPKIKIINQANQGLPTALNNGFAAAAGQYWTWTSTDNVVSPNWLEELVKALDNAASDVGYAFSYYAGIDATDKFLFVNRDIRFDLPHLLFCNAGNASFLYRAELARKVGPYDANLVYAEDLDMWVRMADCTKAIAVPTVLYYYRVHHDAMSAQQEKVKNATRGVVDKYLAKYQNKFDIERLFPHITLSANPANERWRARVWLSTLSAGAHFYCPANAIIDQLMMALNESYDSGLVANIVHLYVKINQWQKAAEIVQQYCQADKSELLQTLAVITTQEDSEALQKIPFVTLDETFLAKDCPQRREILRNFTILDNPLTVENVVVDLINQLEDFQDHPQIWQKIAELSSSEDNALLLMIREYITALLAVPQTTEVSLLLKILEAVCQAYDENAENGIQKLKQLHCEHPELLVVSGAYHFIQRDLKIVVD